MNKITIYIVVVILGLSGLIWLARPTDQKTVPAAASGGAALVVEENPDYNFGTISMAAGMVKHVFSIKNTSPTVVTINKMYTSCMCTTAELTVDGKKIGPYGMPGHGAIPKIDENLAPGDEALIEVVFDPAAHGPAGVGRIQRVVTIENSTGRPVELGFSALVTP
ncbi:MAG: DUF1573 domain-containing protein [Patescibacteria group bacterium]